MNEILTLGDYVDKFDHITDLTENGNCSNCGGCCSNYLPISDHDKKKISEYVLKHDIHDMRQQLPTEVMFDMRCPFRDESTSKCVIYPVRPQICRSFQCNMEEKDIQRNKKVFHHRYKVCNLEELIRR